MNVKFLFWFFIMGLSILFELGSPGFFFFLSFAAGACASAFTSLFNENFAAQLTVFVLFTVFSLLVLRIFVRRLSKSNYKSNVYALIGKVGLVTQDITPPKKGLVIVNSETWSARSVDYSWIQVGTKVEVVGVSGSHLIVKKVSTD